jgi:hypothetical protein
MDEYVPHNAPQRDPVTVSGGFPTPARDSRGRQSPFSDCALAKLPRGQHEPRLAKLEPNSLCSWLSATAAVRSSNGARRWVSSLPEEEDWEEKEGNATDSFIVHERRFHGWRRWRDCGRYPQRISRSSVVPVARVEEMTGRPHSPRTQGAWVPQRGGWRPGPTWRWLELSTCARSARETGSWGPLSALWGGTRWAAQGWISWWAELAQGAHLLLFPLFFLFYVSPFSPFQIQTPLKFKFPFSFSIMPWTVSIWRYIYIYIIFILNLYISSLFLTSIISIIFQIFPWEFNIFLFIWFIMWSQDAQQWKPAWYIF